jgi:beta-galactosidase beta subunit
MNNKSNYQSKYNLNLFGNSSQEHTIELAEGDTVMSATNGLFNNLYEQDGRSRTIFKEIPQS